MATSTSATPIPSQSPNVIGDVAYVPLWSTAGQVRAWAMVDETSLPIIGRYRWRLGSGQNAVTDVRMPDGRQVLTMQRALLGLPPTGQPTLLHRNGNPLDNRRSNLVLSKAGAARALDHAPDLAQLLVEREADRVLLVPGLPS
jgi:hypothetical protein